MPEYALASKVKTVTPANKDNNKAAGSDLDPEKAIRIEKTVTQRSDLAAENTIRIGDPLGNEKVLFLYEEIEIQPKLIGVGDQTMGAFRQWFQQNLNIPQTAMDNELAGPVKITFVIDENGKVTNIEIPDDPGYGLAEAIIQTLEKSPDWLPGVQNGKKFGQRSPYRCELILKNRIFRERYIKRYIVFSPKYNFPKFPCFWGSCEIGKTHYRKNTLPKKTFSFPG